MLAERACCSAGTPYPKEGMNSRTIAVGLRCVVCLAFLGPVGVAAQTPVQVEKDVIYARTDGSALLADIARPWSGRDRPAIVYVHGGRWVSGRRVNDGGLDIVEWAGLGYFAMTIDFRLAGSSPAPAAYQDLQAAIRWIHAHAEQYGIDADRIYLIGNSSGGHLVALAATLGEGPYERVGGWRDSRSDIRAVISVSGAYDLNELPWGNLWTPLDGDPVEARRLASPVQHVGPNTRPMLIIHSDDDPAVPIQQAIDMAAALAAAGVHFRFARFADRGHMSLTKDVRDLALAFIAEVEEGD